MAEENPQDVDPASNPQVEDAPSTAVPVAEIDTAPAPVAPATNPEVPAITVPRVEIPPPCCVPYGTGPTRKSLDPGSGCQP